MVNRGDVVSCPDGAMAVFGFVGMKSWLEQRLTQSRWVATDSSVRKRLCWWIPSSGGKIHPLLNCSVSLCRGGRCTHTHTHTLNHTVDHTLGLLKEQLTVKWKSSHYLLTVMLFQTIFLWNTKGEMLKNCTGLFFLFTKGSKLSKRIQNE